MAEQGQRVLDPAGAKQRGGGQDRTQLPGPEAPSLLRQGDRPIQQRLVQVMGDESQTKVVQRALAEGRLLSTETIPHHLPALVQHGALHGVPVADVAVCLQQCRQGQQPCRHRGLAARVRPRALRQRVLKVGIEELMASLAQKHKELSRLACTCDNLLLFRGQRDRRVPHDGLLTMEGSRGSSTSQSTNRPLLSTLYEPLSKQLISVLVGCSPGWAARGVRADARRGHQRE
jgi:hypothetical protein